MRSLAGTVHALFLETEKRVEDGLRLMPPTGKRDLEQTGHRFFWDQNVFNKALLSFEMGHRVGILCRSLCVVRDGTPGTYVLCYLTYVLSYVRDGTPGRW